MLNYANLLSILILCSLSSNILADQTISDKRKITNLTAFSKMYGYASLYCPSDEAAKVNWQKFAVYGSQQVENCSNDTELITKLKELFSPMVPLLQIESSQKKIKHDDKALKPPLPGDYKTTCWNHLGHANTPHKFYSSLRSNREEINSSQKDTDANSNSILIIRYRFAPDNIEDKYLTLKLNLKNIIVEDTTAFMFKNFIGSSDDEISEGMIPLKSCVADSIIFRVPLEYNSPHYLVIFLSKFEELTISNVEITIEGNSGKRVIFSQKEFENIPNDYLSNLEFLLGNTRESIDKNTGALTYRKHPDNSGIPQSPARPVLPVGEWVDGNLTKNIHISFPLSQYSDSLHTYPVLDPIPLNKILSDIKDPDLLDRTNQYVKYAAVMEYWNIIQHFYPYKQILKLDWDKIQKQTYSHLIDQSWDLKTALRYMAGSTIDGHSAVNELNRKNSGVHFLVRKLENKWVVVKTDEVTADIPLGSEVVSIDGKTMKSIEKEFKKFLFRANEATTDNWFMERYVNHLAKDTLQVVFKYPDGKIISKSCSCEPNLFFNWFTQPLSDLGDGILYVNINPGVISDSAFTALDDRLKKAKGIIMDVRAYIGISPELNWKFMSKVLNKKYFVNSDKLTYFTKPDQIQNYAFGRLTSWFIKPDSAKYNAKLVLLTSPKAVSQCESALLVYKACSDATLIGETTAGTTGDIVDYILPGNFKVTMTGLYVTNPDGSRFHGIGVKPDIEVKPTIKGITEGRDEVLERAVEYLKNKKD